MQISASSQAKGGRCKGERKKKILWINKISFDALILSGNDHKGHGRRASTSPYPYTLSLCVQFFPLYQQLSCMHSFTLSFHLTTDLPLLLGPSLSLTYTFFTNFSYFFLSIWQNHLTLYNNYNHNLHVLPSPFNDPLHFLENWTNHQ